MSSQSQSERARALARMRQRTQPHVRVRGMPTQAVKSSPVSRVERTDGFQTSFDFLLCCVVLKRVNT